MSFVLTLGVTFTTVALIRLNSFYVILKTWSNLPGLATRFHLL